VTEPQPPPAQVLPDTGKVQFLAPASDPRPGKEGTVYGAGHITTYDASDKEFIVSCYLDGKIALIPEEPPPDPPVRTAKS